MERTGFCRRLPPISSAAWNFPIITDSFPSSTLMYEAIKQGVSKSPSEKPFVMAITSSNLWTPASVSSLSLTWQETEITTDAGSQLEGHSDSKRYLPSRIQDKDTSVPTLGGEAAISQFWTTVIKWHMWDSVHT